MASFELRSNQCDGHIRALSRAIQVTSRFSKDAVLEFKSERMKLCAKTEHHLVKFIFTKDFFNEYTCDRRHRCYLSTKALLLPFKSIALMGDKETLNRAQEVKVRCTVEDEINNRIVFKIAAGPDSTTLTYRICINDLPPREMNSLDAINKSVPAWVCVELSPKQGKKERFLLSAFNNFAPEMDQVTAKCSASEVKFIGSASLMNNDRLNAVTSEFTHSRDDFHDFKLKEDLLITFQLRHVKLFLGFVEANKIQLNPKYIFEGRGTPAHFYYECTLFKAHLVTSTGLDIVPEPLTNIQLLQIANGPNESFILDDEHGLDDEDDADLQQFVASDGEETEDDGYNDNESEEEEDLLDGNLDRLNTPAVPLAYAPPFFGVDSIRSEMKVLQNNPEKVREILNIDQDPDEIENVQVIYSSSSDDDDNDY